MKKIILTILAAATLLSAPPAWAWIYNDGDVLLVFRTSGLDIEYDLGSVTNFLGKANGYTTTVSNWDPTQLTGAVLNGFIGAKVVLLATGQTNYLSSPEPNTTAYNIDSQEADTLHGVVSAIGTTPLYPLAIPSNSPNAYVIDTGGDFKASAYDSVVSGGQFNGISQLGGNAPFTVEQVLPASLDFWQIQSSSVYPNPPPDHLIGVFNVATNGVITFVAGPRQSKINSVSRSGNVSGVQFTTTIGTTYAVAYTNIVGGAASTWPVDATTLVGDGRSDTLNHTNSGNAAEFYRVTAQ
jgi:hypothetical protein